MNTQTNNTGSGVTGGNNPAASDNSGGGAITTAALTKALTRAFTLTRQMTDDRIILQANGVARNRAALVAADLGGIYLLEEEGYFVERMKQNVLPPIGGIITQGGTSTIADTATDTSATESDTDTDGNSSGEADGVVILGEPYNYTIQVLNDNMAEEVLRPDPDIADGMIPYSTEEDTASTTDRSKDDAAGLDPTEKGRVHAYAGRLCTAYGPDGRRGLFVTTTKRFSRLGSSGFKVGMSLALVAYLDDNTAADALAFATATQAAMVRVSAEFREAQYLFSDTSEEAEQWRTEQLAADNEGLLYIDGSGAVQRVTYRRNVISRYYWQEVPEGLSMFAGLVLRHRDTRQLHTPSSDPDALDPWMLPQDVVVDFDDRDDSGIFSNTVQQQLHSLMSNPTLVSHYTGKVTHQGDVLYSTLLFQFASAELVEKYNASAFIDSCGMNVAKFDLNTNKWRK